MSEPTDETGRVTTPVSEEEVAAAMGVSSVPDEVRTASTDPDETNLVIDGSGELRPPAEEEPEQDAAKG